MLLRSDDTNKNVDRRDREIDPRINQSLLTQHDKDADIVKDTSLDILQKLTALRDPAARGSDIWLNDLKSEMYQFQLIISF